VENEPLGKGNVLIAASPLRDGMVLRAMGPGPEAVGRWLRQRLAFLPELLGDDPWQRKF
jgi:hypothetical protein